jgi:hypothetical protein
LLSLGEGKKDYFKLEAYQLLADGSYDPDARFLAGGYELTANVSLNELYLEYFKQHYRSTSGPLINELEKKINIIKKRGEK